MNGYLIGDMAKRLGISGRTIRYYEELGLIASERSSGGFRIFNSSQFEKLHMILALKDLGMPLEEIGKFLQLRQHGTIGADVAPPLLASMKAKAVEFKKTIEKYKAVVKDLEEAIDIIENCKTCHNITQENSCEECIEKRTDNHVPPLMKALL